MCTDTNHKAPGVLLLVVLCASCSNLLNLNKAITDAKPAIDTVARSAGQNLSQGLSENAKLISQQLISGLKGATDTLNPDILRIEKVIDSLGDLTAAQLVKLGDSLTTQVAKIEGQVESQALQKYLVNTLESLTDRLNKGTRNLLSNMIQTTLDSLKTKSSGDKINAILASLLNDSTQRRMGVFVNGRAPTHHRLAVGKDRRDRTQRRPLHSAPSRPPALGSGHPRSGHHRVCLVSAKPVRQVVRNPYL